MLTNRQAESLQRGVMWVVTVLLLCALVYFAITDPDARTWSLWRNTLRLVGGSILIAVPVGTFAAIVIHRTDVVGRNVAWFVLVALLFVPIYLQAAGWDAWFGRQAWLWQGPRTNTYRMLVAIWIHSAAAIPWVAMIVGAALMQITPELEESAVLDMPVASVLARATLPLCMPAILLSSWWIAVMSAAEMTVTDIYQVRTYAEEVYTNIPLLDNVTFRELAMQTAPRATWIMLGWIGLSLLAISLLARHDFPATVSHRVHFKLGPGRILGTIALWAVVAVIAALPLMNLCIDAGAYVQGGQRGWSAQQFVDLLAKSPLHFGREILWTMVIGASAATLATGLATGFAWIARRRSLASVLTLLVMTVTATAPGPVVALVIISVMNREASDIFLWLYDRTVLAPVLAGAIRALPVAIAVTWWGFRTVPPELLDMAQLDGLGFVGRLRHVVWPVRRELLIAAWCAAFAFAAGDLGATVLVTPPGVSTLSIRIFGLLHAGVDDQVAAVCLVNVLICIALAFAMKKTGVV